MDPDRLRRALHAAIDSFVDALGDVPEERPAARVTKGRRTKHITPALPVAIPKAPSENARLRAVHELRKAGLPVPEELKATIAS